MSAISQELDTALKEALKARDELKISAIRLIKASLKNKEIDKRGPLTDDEVVAVLSTLAKQRRESIEHFSAAGRTDLADKETRELEILQSYLPQQLSPDELDRIIGATIKEAGASSPNDMGKVMKLLMPKIKGAADGKVVNQRVKELLGAAV